MTDKPKLTLVGDSTGTNTGVKTTRGKPYKGQPKTGSVKTPVNSEGLTVKQEAFCIAILNGTGWSDAYREAYNSENMSTSNSPSRSIRTRNKPQDSR
jgi:hypothetical protein